MAEIIYIRSVGTRAVTYDVYMNMKCVLFE